VSVHTPQLVGELWNPKNSGGDHCRGGRLPVARGAAAVSSELGACKQNRVQAVCRPDALTGLQRFQSWPEEHRPGISEPAADLTAVWLPQYLSNFQTEPVQSSAPIPLPPSLPWRLTLSLAVEATFSAPPVQFPVLLYFQIPSLGKESGTAAQENRPRH